MGDIHVNRPTAYRFRVMRHCDKCKCRRRHIGCVYEWYDPEAFCCTCYPAKARLWMKLLAYRSAAEWRHIGEGRTMGDA